MNSAYLHSTAEVLEELRARGFFPDCSALVTDHRKLSGPQDVFVAVPGQQFDPRNLADDLIRDSRCGLVLVEHDDRRVYQSTAVVPVLHLKRILPEVAHRYFECPSDSLNVYAVTGTNGKTTVTRWLAQALNAMGRKAAVIGTLGYGSPDAMRSHAGLTTPDAVGLQHILFDLKREGFDAVCLEASSIGLEQRRMAHLNIETALFTNLSQDHLDYHGSMEAYGNSKMLLANWPTLRLAVAMGDDPWGQRFLQLAGARGVKAVGVGQSEGLDYRIQSIEHLTAGLCVHVLRQGLGIQAKAPVLGEFNANNLALVLAALCESGFATETVVSKLSGVDAPAGRMQIVSQAPCVVVDYAHTPDALEKVIAALRPLAARRNGRLLLVFGCGGDRDRGKRPLMGAISVAGADQVIITSDNPRSEDPAAISANILEGIGVEMMPRVEVELDRVSAIALALKKAKPDDVVLIAGKGHEQTQTLSDRVIPHCDASVANVMLQQLRRGGK